MDRNEMQKEISNLKMQVNVEREIVDEFIKAIRSRPDMVAKLESLLGMVERKRTGK